MSFSNACSAVPTNHFRLINGNDAGITTTSNSNSIGIAANGMIFVISSAVDELGGDWKPYQPCLPDCAGTSALMNCAGKCAQAYIDVNGFRGPNRFGRDIFSFYIDKDGKVIPKGYGRNPAWNWDDNSKYCDPAYFDNPPDSRYNGDFCTLKALRDIDY